jgi:hypothetical protein
MVILFEKCDICNARCKDVKKHIRDVHQGTKKRRIVTSLDARPKQFVPAAYQRAGSQGVRASENERVENEGVDLLIEKLRKRRLGQNEP